MKRWTLLLLFVSMPCFATTYYVANTGNSFVSTPAALFLNSSIDDYHLKTGSTAVDYGFLLSDVTDDLEGKPRPIVASDDLGAHEAGAGRTDSAPPSTTITSPSIEASVGGTITISANASDDCSLNRVQFFALSPNNKNKTSSFKGIVVY